MDGFSIFAKKLAANAGSTLMKEAFQTKEPSVKSASLISVQHELESLATVQHKLESLTSTQHRPAPLAYTQYQLKPFRIGALGNFPYYWQNPRNLKFNQKTYDWIRANLKAGTIPFQQGQIFTNLYIDALSKVSYSLSKEDQENLRIAQGNIMNKERELIEAWKQAFGDFPPGDGILIDKIINQIVQNWAAPPTTLTALQKSANIKDVLNKTPASGQSVLPVLLMYLNALNSNIALYNATTMNTGYLLKALDATQFPSEKNGGLEIDNGNIQPNFIVSTPLESILKGLNSIDKTNEFEINASVNSSSKGRCKIKLDSNELEFANSDFLNLTVDNEADYFAKQIVSSNNPTSVKIVFTGVTMVHFGPGCFSETTGQDWYWPKPIIDAVKNGDQDITGFKFAPKPQIDFSESGPFGFLTGVAISKKLHFSIETQTPNYKEIAQHLAKAKTIDLDFLNVKLGQIDSLSKQAGSVITNDTNKSIKINFNPAANTSGDQIDSTAFVLGVQTEFPIV